MGIITEISQQKNKKRVNIFVDGEFRSGLGIETAIKFGLKSGKVIEDKELEEIIVESETKSAFDVALNYLSLTPKSKYEVKQKLFKKGYSADVIDIALQKLEEYHYIDDESYARVYIDSISKKSKKEIERKLRIKGISKDIIDEIMCNYDDSNEESTATEYAKKYVRNKSIDEKTLKNLIANLMRKGYSYDLSYTIMQKIKHGEEI